MTVRLDAMLQAVELPAGVSNLTAGLADVNRNTLALQRETRSEMMRRRGESVLTMISPREVMRILQERQQTTVPSCLVRAHSLGVLWLIIGRPASPGHFHNNTLSSHHPTAREETEDRTSREDNHCH